MEVTDDSHGSLHAQAIYAGTDSEDVPHFTNHYVASDTTVSFSGTKTVNGEDAEAGYSFDLRRVGVIGPDGVVEPENTLVYNTGVTDGSFTFTELVYTQADIGKTFRYEITEEIPLDATAVIEGETVTYADYRDLLVKDVNAYADATPIWKYRGVIYDTTVYGAEVTVYDNHDGTLGTVFKYTLNGEEIDAPCFANIYEAEGTAQLQVKKQLTGRDWAEDDAFSFTLEALTENAPMPEGTSDAQVATAATQTELDVETETPDTDSGEDGEVRIALFDEISFTLEDAAQTYTYRIREVIPAGAVRLDNGGWLVHTPDGPLVYDGGTWYCDVTVTDNGDGTMNAEPVYYQDRNALDAEVPEENIPLFTNCQYASAQTSLFAQKRLTGRDWKPGDSFTFRLIAVSNDQGIAPERMPMPEQSEAGTLTKDATAGSHIVEFGPIVFPQEGVYKYQIAEIIPDEAVAQINGSSVTYRQATDEQKANLTLQWLYENVYYNAAPHSVVVTVAPDIQAQCLVASVRYDDSDDVEIPVIENPYVEPKPDTKEETVPETKPDTKTETVPETQSTSQPETTAQSETQAQTQAATRSETQVTETTALTDERGSKTNEETEKKKSSSKQTEKKTEKEDDSSGSKSAAGSPSSGDLSDSVASARTSAKTGDTTPILARLLAMLAAAVVACGCVYSRRRRRNKCS